jgi:hypothetical protein
MMFFNLAASVIALCVATTAAIHAVLNATNTAAVLCLAAAAMAAPYVYGACLLAAALRRRAVPRVRCPGVPRPGVPHPIPPAMARSAPPFFAADDEDIGAAPLLTVPLLPRAATAPRAASVAPTATTRGQEVLDAFLTPQLADGILPTQAVLRRADFAKRFPPRRPPSSSSDSDVDSLL